jgi:Fe-S oxidoreductase/nitrate reductase gamma subunit
MQPFPVPTREILWNVPKSVEIGMYVSMGIAAVIFFYGFYKRYTRWMRGKPEVRLNRVQWRVWDFFYYAIGHRRIAEQAYPGIMHLSIFIGFLILFIGTDFVALQYDLGLHIIFGKFYLYFSLFLDLFGLAFMGGILLASWRRFVIKPEKLDSRWDDIFGLAVLFFIAATGFVTEGLRIVATGFPPFEIWSPVGWIIGKTMAGFTVPQLKVIHLTFWIIHFALILTFIVAMPFTKLSHIFIAPINIFFRSQTPKGALAPVPNIEEVESYGASSLSDFTWKQLLGADACLRCGRCHEVCPAKLSDKPLSPKNLIVKIADKLKGGEELYSNIENDELWSCTTCRACMQACPVFVEHVDTIVDMRRFLLFNGKLTGAASKALQKMMNYGNPWGLQESRTQWAEGLDVKTVQDSKDFDVLYWVGCMGAYDPRNRKVAQAFARIMKKAGVKFAILGDEEKCTGDSARRLGEEMLFTMMAQENIETLKKYNVTTIVTHCPHCYNTLKNEYPQLGGNFKVISHTEFIQSLMREGKIKLSKSMDKTTTFHDPCYLGRYNDIYNPPRNILGEVSGLKQREMKKSRENAFCCGGGGGHMWMDLTIGKRINHMRLEDSIEVDPDFITVACPFCMAMFDDAIKFRDLVEKVGLKDVAEVVLESMEE